jgi:hypothetical protein
MMWIGQAQVLYALPVFSRHLTRELFLKRPADISEELHLLVLRNMYKLPEMGRDLLVVIHQNPVEGCPRRPGQP